MISLHIYVAFEHKKVVNSRHGVDRGLKTHIPAVDNVQFSSGIGKRVHIFVLTLSSSSTWETVVCTIIWRKNGHVRDVG